MMFLHVFHLAHHLVELVFSIVIAFSAYYALKSFKLVIWKKGWLLMLLSGIIFFFVELWELLESLDIVKETEGAAVIVHVIHMIAFPLIAIGILMLAKSANRIWGKIKSG
jgi:hypothetical protein